MSNKLYYSKTALTGGAAAALDYIDGSLLADGDMAFVSVSGVLYVYRLNATSGAAESSPNIIAPDTNPGNKRWILQAAYASSSTAGLIKQVVETTYGTYANTSTVIPYDDTIPQITEGAEAMTRAITPASVSNILLINVMVHVSCAVPYIVALFQDATANALSMAVGVQASATWAKPNTLTFAYKMAAGTTSSTTFRVRYGPGTAGTAYINGDSGSRMGGGILLSSITITEIAQ